MCGNTFHINKELELDGRSLPDESNRSCSTELVFGQRHTFLSIFLEDISPGIIRIQDMHDTMWINPSPTSLRSSVWRGRVKIGRSDQSAGRIRTSHIKKEVV